MNQQHNVKSASPEMIENQYHLTLALHRAYATYYNTASFNPLPAENTGTFLALILIAFPVRGLRPVLAFLFFTEKLPNPMRLTFSPLASAPLMASITASTAATASFLLIPVSATAEIRSALVIYRVPFFRLIRVNVYSPPLLIPWRLYLSSQDFHSQLKIAFLHDPVNSALLEFRGQGKDLLARLSELLHLFG